MENIVKEIHEGTKLRPCTDHNYPPHFHNELEMIFVLEGSFNVSINGQEYKVEADSIFLAAPGTIHAYKSPINSCKTLLLIVDPAILSGAASQLVSKVPIYPIWHGNRQKYIVWDLVRYAYENRASMHPENFVLTLSTAASLIVSDMALEGVKYKIRAEQKILMYCLDHYREPITLNHIASALDFSESYVSHIFSEKLKISFPSYINSLRLKDAAKMLETSNTNILEIASLSGFTSLSSFNHTFLKYYQMTPSEYRKSRNTNATKKRPRRSEDT